MQLKEIMTRSPEIVPPATTAQEAAEKMESLNVGFLPVGDASNVIGVVTDRDITVRAVSAGRDPKKVHVKDIMTERVEKIREDADVQEAAKVMERQQIRRLVVTDGGGRCVGVVSLGDLAVKTGDEPLSGEVLEEVSEPARPAR